MGCGCRKKTETRIGRARRLAAQTAAAEKETQVIYETDGELYIERLGCWQRGGRPGKMLELVFPI